MPKEGDGFDSLLQQMHHSLIGEHHDSNQLHQEDYWNHDPTHPAFNNIKQFQPYRKPKEEEHYHPEKHDSNSHGSHNWKDLSYGVASYLPHGHPEVIKNKIYFKPINCF